MTAVDPGTPGVVRYAPSPRPDFAVPSAITAATVTRHIWGDAEAGEVADWIYASTARIHALIFGLAAGKPFRHSREFRTVFGADEVLHVLEGTLVIANPETGEVQRIPQGGHVFFRAGTWHHAFAHGGEPLRVLEFLAPPPAAGTTGAYARQQPYLEESRYVDDALLGRLVGDERPRRTLTPLRDEDAVLRLEGDALVGLLVSTEHLTVATLALDAGGTAPAHTHAGDELLYVQRGTLHLRAWQDDATYVFELGPGDAALVPQGARHEYRNYGREPVAAILGVAPDYRPVTE